MFPASTRNLSFFTKLPQLQQKTQTTFVIWGRKGNIAPPGHFFSTSAGPLKPQARTRSLPRMDSVCRLSTTTQLIVNMCLGDDQDRQMLGPVRHKHPRTSPTDHSRSGGELTAEELTLQRGQEEDLKVSASTSIQAKWCLMLLMLHLRAGRVPGTRASSPQSGRSPIGATSSRSRAPGVQG